MLLGFAIEAIKDKKRHYFSFYTVHNKTFCYYNTYYLHCNNRLLYYLINVLSSFRLYCSEYVTNYIQSYSSLGFWKNSETCSSFLNVAAHWQLFCNTKYQLLVKKMMCSHWSDHFFLCRMLHFPWKIRFWLLSVSIHHLHTVQACLYCLIMSLKHKLWQLFLYHHSLVNYCKILQTQILKTSPHYLVFGYPTPCIQCPCLSTIKTAWYCQYSIEF